MIRASSDSPAHCGAQVGRDTPLHSAALAGNEGLVELLLARGAVINARNGLALTPMAMAVSGGHRHIAELLRRHGGID